MIQRRRDLAQLGIAGILDPGLTIAMEREAQELSLMGSSIPEAKRGSVEKGSCVSSVAGADRRSWSMPILISEPISSP